MGKIRPYNVMLIYAALQNVPAELYEAADLDNASRVSRFFKITLPMISPQLFMLTINATIISIMMLAFIGAWNDYFWPFIMTTSKEVYP